MGYLVKATPAEIITAKVTLTKADLLTPGFIYDIPEYPAVKGYFWNVLYMSGEIINGSIPYTGTSSIHIQTAAAPNLQLRFNGGYMQNITGVWDIAQPGGTNPTRYIENSNLQIHNPGTLTVGDTELILYIGANLIQY
jgi:hypothetical protein